MKRASGKNYKTIKRTARPKKGLDFLTIALGLVAIGALALIFSPVGEISKKSLTGPTYKVYFLKNEKLTAAERPLKPDAGQLQQAIEGLMAGPSNKEQLDGITTQLPAGIKIRQIKVEKGVAIIDLSSRLEDYGGGSAMVEGLVAQIVYTATEVPGVEKAWIWEDGQGNLVLGGEGLVLDHPLGRQDVKN
jgi:spore germination protein GerM